MGVELREGTLDDVDPIAQLWAEATATRGGDPDVAGLELSRPLDCVQKAHGDVANMQACTK